VSGEGGASEFRGRCKHIRVALNENVHVFKYPCPLTHLHLLPLPASFYSLVLSQNQELRANAKLKDKKGIYPTTLASTDKTKFVNIFDKIYFVRHNDKIKFVKKDW